MKNPKIIAEIGCNHKGKIELAKEMVMVCATFCKVDYVKFQKRNPRELLTEEQYNAPHPNPENSYGNTYGEHREFLELSLAQHQELKILCEELKIGYSCSVWDLTSTKEIVGLNPDLIKIPSACNNNFEIIKYLCENYQGQIHISLGMTTQKEEVELIKYLKNKNSAHRTVLYSCTSGYPVDFEDLCLYEIKRIKAEFGSEVHDVGFSGHHLGIAADVAALTLGANWIERHFTLDRTWKGTDHAASLEPQGLRKLVRDLNHCKQALTYKGQEILTIEEAQRNKLKNKK